MENQDISVEEREAYDWEREAAARLQLLMIIAEDKGIFEKSEFQIIGIGIANNETVEGAYIPVVETENEHDLYMMDVCKDISGDAEAIYSSVIHNSWLRYNDKLNGQAATGSEEGETKA